MHLGGVLGLATTARPPISVKSSNEHLRGPLTMIRVPIAASSRSRSLDAVAYFERLEVRLPIDDVVM